MRPLQILGSQRNKRSSEVTPDARKLLGSRDRGLQSRWETIEVDDIYFIIGLSCWGEVVNIKAQGAGVGMTMEDYIATHCVASTNKVGSRLTIREIENLSLKIIILVRTWISSSASLQ
jgi:hypothetical protein